MENTGHITSDVSIHAGFPNPAVDGSLEGLRLEQLLIKHPASTFFWRIQGEQWEDQGIFDGDIAIVDRALTPRNKDLVVWPDEESFCISKVKTAPKDKEVWGVITTIIHQFIP